jgi:hypothetical protein
MRSNTLALALSAALGVLAVPAAARADDKDTAATGAAASLFDEGVALLNKGKLAEACPKLQRSQELAPNGGTLLTLAECYEKNGQFASAWVAYKEAADRAVTAHKADAEKLALEGARKLEPKISKLTVQVSQRSEVDGLVIKRDGKAVVQAEWNTPVPLDPGLHTFSASAPGRKTWSARVAIGNAASQKSIEVPLLELAVGDQSGDFGVMPSSPAADDNRSTGKGQRVVGLVVAGLGVVGLGVGTAFGLQAKSKNDDAASHCVADTRCDATGIQLDKDARTAATISTISFIAGGALAATGLVVFFTAPSKKESAASVGVRATPGGAAMTFGATF